MLSRLHGPAAITIDGDETGFLTPGDVAWHDDLGFVGSGRSLLTSIVQLDGQGHTRGNRLFSGPLLPNMQTGGLAMRQTSAWYSQVDMRSLRPVPPASYTVPSGQIAPWCVLPNGRLVYALAGVVYTRAADGSTVNEATLHPGAGKPGGYGAISQSRTGTVFVGFRDGRIYEYDWMAQEVVGAIRYVPAVLGGPWYSRELGVFLALTGVTAGVQYVSVYADEVEPDSLSAPALVGAAKPGVVATVRARLLGDEGEACAGWPVAWEITGDDVELLAEQSVTDEDGYATVGVRIDPTATAAAEFDVTASVLY